MLLPVEKMLALLPLCHPGPVQLHVLGRPDSRVQLDELSLFECCIEFCS